MEKTIELLAPAGSPVSLHAAVRAGADAVYLGLDSFNARRGAENFTLESFAEACDFAHLRDVRVYVTFNIAILSSEFSRALETARQAFRAGADAFIVQDIGVAAELLRTLPEANLHFSTQMNIHNEAGLRAAAKLGARRVTLARELSLEEIEHLVQVASSYQIDIEVFAHGALCVCYSGQCFMSSLIGGRSANRGTCAQPCRLPYELRNKALRKSLPSPGDHLLSPQDLSSIHLLPYFVEAGISSLKIEGRMKSPEYVFAVVSVYRQMLDRTLTWKNEGAREESFPQVTQEEQDLLAEAFSRGFTTAYLENQRGNDIMSYGRPNNRGVFVGRVVSAKGGSALVSVEKQLAVGDVLEFWTNKGHFAYVLDVLTFDKAGNVVVSPDRPVGKGDRVFRVRSAEASFEDSAFEPRISVDGYVRLKKDQPLYVEFFVPREKDETPKFHVSVEGEVVQAARTRPLAREDVRAHIDRLGQTPFMLGSLHIEMDDGVGIGFSQLHRIRAKALENLASEMLKSKKDRILPKIANKENLAAARPCGLHVVAWATNPACARAAKRAGAEVIYVPSLNYKRGEAVIAGQRNQTAEQAGYPKQVVVALPPIEHDCVGSTREAKLDFSSWRYVKAKKPVLVENIGDLVEAVERGAYAEVGSHLPITNKASLELVAELGAKRVWLSPELTLGQIADLAQDTPVELGLTIVGSQELMVTEHCLLMSQGDCDENCNMCPRRKSPHYLKDRKDFEFPVVTDFLGRSHIYNAVQLDVVHAMPDLINAGLTYLMVDTTLMNVEETSRAVAHVVRARNVANSNGVALTKASGTTSGHLFRGVS